MLTRRQRLFAANNGGGNLRRQLLDGAPFLSELLHTAVPTRAAPGTTGTFTRATTSTWPNNDGYLVTGVAGEIGFVGARRVRNLLTFTEDFSNAAWLKSSAGAGSVPVVTSDQEANPISGVAYADKIVFAAPGAGDLSMLQQSFTGATGSAYRGSFYVKAFAAGDVGKVILFRHAAGGSYTQVTLTAAYQRVSLKETGIGAVTFDIGLRPTFSSSSGTVSVYLTAAQLEDVTAQTTQTAGEYVSVGVVQRNVLTYTEEFDNAVWTGTATRTANTTANPIDGALTADTLTSAGAYQSRLQSVSVTASTSVYCASVYFLKTSGASSFPGLQLNASGGSTYSATLNTDTGVATARTGEVPASIAVASVGNYWRLSITGANESKTAMVLVVQPAVNADGSATWTGPAGSCVVYGAQLEVAAAVTSYQAVGGSYVYHGSFVDGVKCFPTDLSGNPIPSTTLLGYQAQGARTNLCLQSNAFTTTWAASGTPAATQNVVGPDGATTAWTLTDDAGTLEWVYQDITLTAATYTASLFIKKTTGTPTAYPVLFFYPAAATTSMAAITVDTTNGIATPWTSYTGFTGVSCTADCKSFNDDFWRVQWTFTGTAVAWRLNLAPAGATDAVYAGPSLASAAQGSAVFYGAQVELGSFATPYQPTTTVAVARNANLLTYTGGSFNKTEGTMYAVVNNAARKLNQYVLQLDDGSNTNRVWLVSSDASGTRQLSSSGGGSCFSPSAYTVNTDQKVATSYSSGANVSKQALAGSLGSAGTYTPPGGSLTTLRVGANVIVGGLELNGGIRNIYIWNRKLSDSELQAITS